MDLFLEMARKNVAYLLVDLAHNHTLAFGFMKIMIYQMATEFAFKARPVHLIKIISLASSAPVLGGSSRERIPYYLQERLDSVLINILYQRFHIPPINQ